MILREMMIDDLDEVMKIEEELFSVPWTREGFFTFLTRDDSMFLVVEEKEKILGWCIKGYQIYKDKGLIEPLSAKIAKDEYKNQMDIVAQFISKECIVDENASVGCKVLYSRYKEWAMDNTEFTMKESRFSEELRKKGITIKKSTLNPPKYIGLKLCGVNIGG